MKLACAAICLALAAPALAQRPKVYSYADRPLSPGQMQVSAPGGKLDSPPRFLRGDSPKYPITQAWKQKGGVAVIAFKIDESGRTRDLRVVKADYPAFGAHAVLAIKHWQFEPAKRNGKPVVVDVRMAINFTADAQDRLR